MFKNRFLLVLGVISLLLVSMAVSRPYSNASKAANLSWPPRPVIVPLTGAGDQSYIMDSATRSYIAWGEALKAANRLGNSVVCSNTTQESIFDGIDNNLDSATRSYVAWGMALEAAHNAKALDSATRSYIAWGQALRAKNNSQAFCG